MPHFVLDARTATPHFPGIGRYVTNLARAMTPLLAADERLTVIVDPAHPIALPPSPAVQTMPLAVSPFSPAQQKIIPQLLRRLQDDHAPNLRPPTLRHTQGKPSTIYHSPYIAMPYLPGVPALLTVYDLIPLRYPEHSTARARLLVRWMTRLALRAARHVIAISEFTRRDFMAEFGLAPERITAIPLAADPVFKPQPPEVSAAVRQKYGLPEQFAFYLGSNKPHKNLPRLVEAWRMAGGGWQAADGEGQMAVGGLVIAGAWDARYPQTRGLTQRQEASPNPSTCSGQALQPPIWLGPVPEADLPALYAAAAVFVFPSLYEGFGFPVLEAMASGTPVICSNTSSLPEVAGEAAVTVDPLNVAELAAALARVLSDAGLRCGLRAGGLAQARRFNWQDTARRTLDLYRQIAGGPAG